MKLKTKFLILIGFIILVSFIPNKAKATDGPCTDDLSYIYFSIPETNYNSTKYIFLNNNVTNIKDNVYYDLSTNTLTLNNLITEEHLDILGMGDDFKLNLIGKNKVGQISISAEEYGGNLNIIGEGSLTINEKKDEFVSYGIEMFGGNIHINNNVKLHIYSEIAAIGVYYTKEADINNVVVFENQQNTNIIQEDRKDGYYNYFYNDTFLHYNSISILETEITGLSDKTYTGAEINQEPIIKRNNEKLLKNIDYTISFINNINVGTATIIITGINDYTGVTEIDFRIKPKSIGTVIISDFNDRIFIGKSNPITQKVIIKDGNNILKENTDYTIEYSNNINVGTANVTITGINNYGDSVEDTFGILPKNIQTFTCSNILDKAYSATKVKQEIVLKDGDIELKNTEDYIISYKNNVNVGIATVTITGIGNYTGTIERNFNIMAQNISNTIIDVNVSNVEYTGRPINPNISIIYNNKELTKDIDYSLNFLDNINSGIAKVIITGCGNYTGQEEITFKILAKDVSKLDISNVEAQIYTGANIEPSIIVKDGNITLIENKDYELTYSNNKNVGFASILVKGIGNYTGTRNVEFEIKENEVEEIDINKCNISEIVNTEYTGKEIILPIIIKNENVTLKEDTDYTITYQNNKNVGTATITIQGKGNYVGSIIKTFNITTKQLSNLSATIDTNNKKYTGKDIKTSIILKNGDLILKEGIDYNVKYKNNKNTGKATVTITGKGNYVGTITRTFNIVPKKATLSSVKNNKKKSVKVTWKKDTQATGYEVYMSTSKNGTYTKVKTVTKNKTTNFTKSKLKKKKTYYFKIRSYKTIDGKKVYGSYSTEKKVVIKK